MNMQQLGVDELLQKEMNRKEFLKHVGIAIVALTGASAVAKALLQQPTTNRQNVLQQPMGYGSMPYGGTKRQ
jgi:Trp operon repressor